MGVEIRENEKMLKTPVDKCFFSDISGWFALGRWMKSICEGVTFLTNLDVNGGGWEIKRDFRNFKFHGYFERLNGLMGLRKTVR